MITDSSVSQTTLTDIPFIGIGPAIESWIVGNVVERGEATMLAMTFSARNWIQGNTFKNWGLIDGIFNTSGITITKATNDNVVENNYLVDFVVGFYMVQGSRGNVIAYNYLRQGTPPNAKERGIYIHGQYSGELLVEGNDTDANISTDIWWGRQGPRIGFFRNRSVTPTPDTWRDASLGANSNGEARWDQSSNDPHSTDELFMIGNTAEYFYTNWMGSTDDNALGSTQDVDNYSANMWLEKNISRIATTCNGDPGECVGGSEPGSLCTVVGDCAGGASACTQKASRCGFHMDTPEATTSCGTAYGDCLTGTDGQGINGILGNNYTGSAPSADHANDTSIPHSLYRTTVPSWWCQEACDWDDVHKGIGAWGDDFGETLCKLPAEIVLVDGTTCTPMSAAPHRNEGISLTGASLQ
jgi:hypothetical protein